MFSALNLHKWLSSRRVSVQV